jgi:hypothetical protein
MIVPKPVATLSESDRPTSTPPASVLCRMSGDTIFITTGKPIFSARFTASSAVAANPSPGVGMP